MPATIRGEAKNGKAALHTCMSVIIVSLMKQASTASGGLLRTTFASSGSLPLSASMAVSQRSRSPNEASAIAGGGISGTGELQMIWLPAWPLALMRRWRMAQLW